MNAPLGDTPARAELWGAPSREYLLPAGVAGTTDGVFGKEMRVPGSNGELCGVVLEDTAVESIPRISSTTRCCSCSFERRLSTLARFSSFGETMTRFAAESSWLAIPLGDEALIPPEFQLLEVIVYWSRPVLDQTQERGGPCGPHSVGDDKIDLTIDLWRQSHFGQKAIWPRKWPI